MTPQEIEIVLAAVTPVIAEWEKDPGRVYEPHERAILADLSAITDDYKHHPDERRRAAQLYVRVSNVVHKSRPKTDSPAERLESANRSLSAQVQALRGSVSALHLAAAAIRAAQSAMTGAWKPIVGHYRLRDASVVAVLGQVVDPVMGHRLTLYRSADHQNPALWVTTRSPDELGELMPPTHTEPGEWRRACALLEQALAAVEIPLAAVKGSAA